MEKVVVTIGREFGSGGKDIGEKTAEKLGVSCYDKELLQLAAKDSGFCKEIFEHNDEKPTKSFLYSLVMDTNSMWGYSQNSYVEMPLNQKVFLAQFDTIKSLAQKESCVIVGRCADYALENMNNVCNVFVHANLDYRIANIAKRFQLNDAKAKDLILKTDKSRASYYNYYASKKWGDSRAYNLTLDSSKLGIDGCVEMILKYCEIMKF